VSDGYASDRSVAGYGTTSQKSGNEVTSSCVTTSQNRAETVAKRRQSDVSSDSKKADTRKHEKGAQFPGKVGNLSENDTEKRLMELERVKGVFEQQLQQLIEQNESLNKEVGRLSHLNQLRAAPVQPQKSAFIGTSVTDKRHKLCFSCGEPGHIARVCPQREKVSQSNWHSQHQQDKYDVENASQKFRRLCSDVSAAVYLHVMVSVCILCFFILLICCVIVSTVGWT